MAYDESKDAVLWETELATGLMLGVHQYDGGEKKFQIGPRVLAKAGGGTAFVKSGRLSLAEVQGICDLMPEIKKAMK